MSTSSERKRKYNKEQAKKLLVHYFETVFIAADLRFSSDNRVEIEDIIDCIFDSMEDDAE